MCVQLVVVEWVGGADVAPKQALDGVQAVGIVIRQLGLIYLGIVIVSTCVLVFYSNYKNTSVTPYGPSLRKV